MQHTVDPGFNSNQSNHITSWEQQPWTTTTWSPSLPTVDLFVPYQVKN
jgi:hypothetical protein